MKKINKSIAAFAVVLMMSSGLSATVVVSDLTDCQNFALDYLEAFEYNFGDVDAETANWIYAVQLYFCENPIQ